MLAERHGLAQRCDEGFAVRAGPQMAANLVANVSGEFIIDIGGQLAQDAQTVGFPMRLFLPGRYRGSLSFRPLTWCHVKHSSALSPAYGHGR